jgi:hypothetical protein
MVYFFQEGAKGLLRGLNSRFPALQNVEEVNVVFVGTKGQFETTRKHALKNHHGCTVRSKLLIKHLKMHKVGN